MNEQKMITVEQKTRLDKFFKMKIKNDEDLIKLAEILDVEEIDDDLTTVFPETARK